MTLHVTPLDDDDEHELLSTCKCIPKVEILDNGDILVVHKAFDERQLIEILFEDTYIGYGTKGWEVVVEE